MIQRKSDGERDTGTKVRCRRAARQRGSGRGRRTVQEKKSWICLREQRDLYGDSCREARTCLWSFFAWGQLPLRLVGTCDRNGALPSVTPEVAPRPVPVLLGLPIVLMDLVPSLSPLSTHPLSQVPCSLGWAIVLPEPLYHLCRQQTHLLDCAFESHSVPLSPEHRLRSSPSPRPRWGVTGVVSLLTRSSLWAILCSPARTLFHVSVLWLSDLLLSALTLCFGDLLSVTSDLNRFASFSRLHALPSLLKLNSLLCRLPSMNF